MKTIKCKVRCQYWDRPDEFEIEVADDATKEQIEAEMLEVAIELAHFEHWIADDK